MRRLRDELGTFMWRFRLTVLQDSAPSPARRCTTEARLMATRNQKPGSQVKWNSSKTSELA